MLSKARTDDSNIKTVKLARGNYSEVGTPSPSFLAARSRTTSERSLPRNASSPEGHTHTPTTPLILSNIGIIELLDHDPRPTFVIDLAESPNTEPDSLHIIFANVALRSVPTLLHLIQPESLPSSPRPAFLDFHQWLLRGEKASDFSFGLVKWTASTVRSTLRIVSGTYEIDDDDAKNELSKSPLVAKSTGSFSPRKDEAQDYFGTTRLPDPDEMEAKTIMLQSEIRTPSELQPASINPADIGFFDWTRLPNTANLPKHVQLAKSVDWASTALGPMEDWSPDLRQMCNLIMASPHPAAMYWGPDLVAIYNEAYVLLAGKKHPQLMGQSYSVAWVEIWDALKGVFESAISTGQATMKEDDMLFLNRSNYLEETYFSWSIIPIVTADGSVCGLYNPAFEKTKRKIAERRMLTLREVGERTALARDVRSFWKEVKNALDTNKWDTPFLLLYSVSSSDDSESDAASIYSSSAGSSKVCNLEGSLGVPDSHPCAPKQVDLKAGREGFAPIFREVLKDGVVLLRVVDDTGGDNESPKSTTNDPEDLATSARLELPKSLLEGIDWRGFGDPCRSVVICPVQPTAGEAHFDPLGFLVLGVNPRRPFDEDYNLFVQLLSRQLATSLASVVLFEEEIKRGQKAAKLAALDRINLSAQLAQRTEEARRIENRFTYMANSSPAGLFIADSDGVMTYVNDTWYEITGIPKDPTCAANWLDYVKDADRDYVRDLWDSLSHTNVDVTAEFRFKSQWQDQSGNTSDVWVLFSAHPEYSHSYGTPVLQTVFGNITNISAQKWAQGFQKRKMEEAVELKRQQENFIDITSHEMRNPLSAVIQCADEISSSLSDVNLDTIDEGDRSRINSSMSAADTIVLCAQHQKRIVDDILTLSKLDSHMLIVTPIDAQPLAILQSALRMFESECSNAGIDLALNVDSSYTSLGVDWVKFDPQRVGQILINLMTNAIKFTPGATSKGSKATIIVSISASTSKPSSALAPPVQYSTHRNAVEANPTDGHDWGDGEILYLQFTVKDTGPGLQEDDRKMLFNRFNQVSPRTHVQYGGSGLGLFISRELAELQGGGIGVSSEPGKGSTFAFFVRVRRATDEPSQREKGMGIPANLKGVNSKSQRVTEKERAAAKKPLKVTEEVKNARSKISVLIVEDNIVNQRVLGTQLKNQGFTVHVANHGGEALDSIRRSSFWKNPEHGGETLDLRVVLMDQEMPVMNGIEATTEIRKWEAQGALVRHVPIIGVTANAREEQITALINSGMVSKVNGKRKKR
jgi:PAS domain S-box-containing protein